MLILCYSPTRLGKAGIIFPMPIESLERALGVTFRDRRLLQLALVHSSFANENPDAPTHSNERLEFLGDAVIGSVVAGELYQMHPGWSEGQLTQARTAIVRGDTLAALARRLSLGDYLCFGKGEEESGGRRRDSNLAGALEAVAGALFLDQGYDAVRMFVVTQLAGELASSGSHGLAKSAKSKLQEAVQSQGLAPPVYEIVHASGKDHAREFTAEVLVDGKSVGRGTGTRKSHAEQAAAAEALTAMGLG